MTVRPFGITRELAQLLSKMLGKKCSALQFLREFLQNWTQDDVLKALSTEALSALCATPTTALIAIRSVLERKRKDLLQAAREDGTEDGAGSEEDVADARS